MYLICLKLLNPARRHSCFATKYIEQAEGQSMLYHFQILQKYYTSHGITESEALAQPAFKVILILPLLQCSLYCLPLHHTNLLEKS